MASLRRLSFCSLFLCLFLLFTAILMCETRPLPAPFSNGKENSPLMERAKQVLEESIRRQQLLGTQYKPNRLSPGGPDPHHH
ncbi:hypothetical protein L6164_018380 [Bauhinia variegata]|uniref:Uncharacterized protein n=1 Tax=Bauhinia variegata TaxID=167791 RepID=A0ACB9NC95_BAUVA|nr:hypothetical protein L6164_018380 [Bauhinia variegata]